MLYATKLTSGETILSQVSDVTNFKLLLIQPLSAEIVDGQLVTMPWPEFLQRPIMDISVHTDNVIFYGPADPEVVDQYERVVALVYQKSDEAEIDEEIGVHFQ